jgi:hypothetical protein
MTDNYKTSDLYLSAYLIAKGGELINIEKNNMGKGVFEIGGNLDIDTLVSEYKLGKGSVVPNLYALAIKDIKRAVFNVLNTY